MQRLMTQCTSNVQTVQFSDNGNIPEEEDDDEEDDDTFDPEQASSDESSQDLETEEVEEEVDEGGTVSWRM
jgi:hypothetical protein